MRMRTRIGMLLVLLFTGAVVSAQSVGIGASVHLSENIITNYLYDGTELYTNRVPQMRVPIHAGNLVFEPEFGFVQVRSKLESETEANEGKLINGLYVLNFYLRYQLINDMFRHGPGIRLGVNYLEYKQKFDGETVVEAYRNQIIGILYSAEHLFSDHFSIGGEAQLNYTFLDDYGDSSLTVKSGLLNTSAKIIFRWYP